MSDVDDDFMCEDEEDYGLVSETAEINQQRNFFTISAFFIVFVLRNFFIRNIQKTATLSQMWTSKINTTTAKR